MLQFINSLKTPQNAALLEYVRMGYLTILESFHEMIPPVVTCIKKLQSNDYSIDPPNVIVLHTPEFGYVNIYVNRSNSLEISAHAYGNGIIDVDDTTLHNAIIRNDPDAIHNRLNDANVMNALAHELGHITEMYKRGVENVNNQIDNMSTKSLKAYKRKDKRHHNHKMERFANSTAMIPELLNGSFSSASKTLDSLPISQHLTPRNKKRILKNIANYYVNMDKGADV